jgi:sulfite reductase (NADPH) flavoprotein alpha-component
MAIALQTFAPAVVKKATGKKVYTGTILTNVNLNDIGSNKETHHIEIAAEGIEYLPWRFVRCYTRKSYCDS